MQDKGTSLDYSGQNIYIGLDVHKKTWKVTVCTPNSVQRTVEFNRPFVSSLKRHLEKHYPKGNYRCAYEAGFSGFWAAEQLQQAGIDCIVVHPPDVPTTDKERKFKTDKRDSRKLSKSLRGGDLRGIYQPSQEAQRDRSLVRERWSIKKSQSRVKNQIKSLLHFYGLDIPEDLAERYWSRRFVNWLEQLSQQRTDESLELKLKRYLFMRQLELEATRKLRKLSKSEKYAAVHRVLISVPGVSLLYGMLLISELIDMNRFKTNEALRSYVGLIPESTGSGEQERSSELTNRGNRKLKTALVECSWTAIRNDPELLLKYESYCKRMSKQKAIIRIARILLRRIRHVWIHRQLYQKVEW